MEDEKNTKENISALYEISFIQEAEEESIPKNFIEKHGGNILEDHPLIKIRFAYPIRKQTQGFLGFIKFAIDPERVSLVNGDLKLEGKVVRHTISHFSEKKGRDLDSFPETRAGKEREKRGKFVRGEKKPSGFNQDLSNEALEKKIEEILQ